MALNKFFTIGNRRIYFNETYFLTYAGGHRELDSKNQKNWDRTLLLPLELQRKERAKLGMMNNPNVIPLTGMRLLEFIQELNFTPFFTKNFEVDKTLVLTSVLIYESIKTKSYDNVLKGE